MENKGYIVAFPRSGTTWLRHMLVCILCNQIIDRKEVGNLSPDLHVHESDFLELSQKVPFVLYKSHFCWYPDYKNEKTVYLYRDGRDVALSYYYFKNLTVPFSQYLRDGFISEGAKHYGGTWKEHVVTWLSKKDNPKIFCISYEELYANTFQVVKDIVNFFQLGTTDEWIQQVIKLTNFEQWSQESYEAGWKHYAIGKRGCPGGWKEEFSQDDLDLFWDWAGDLMQGLGYKK